MLKQFICAVTYAQAKLLPESLDLELSGSWNGCKELDLPIVQQYCCFLWFSVVIVDKKVSVPTFHTSSIHPELPCPLLEVAGLSTSPPLVCCQWWGQRGGPPLQKRWWLLEARVKFCPPSGCEALLFFEGAQVHCVSQEQMLVSLHQSCFTLSIIQVVYIAKKSQFGKYFAIRS